MNAQDKMSTYWAVAAGLAALAAVIVVGAWYYRSQSRFVHRRAVETLVSIGRLKADEIAAWREERLGDAATLQEDPHISELAARYFAAPNDPNARPLLGRFRMITRLYGHKVCPTSTKTDIPPGAPAPPFEWMRRIPAGMNNQKEVSP